MGSSDRPCSSSCSVATMGVILKLSILVAVLMAWWGRVGASRAEVEVLMEIKSALDPTEKILHSWVAEGDPCSGTFEGVACNEHGKVANVSLQGKGLSGSLPSSIADLKCLSGLYLHYNVLKGQIPKELSKLTELLDLYLNVNMLSGSIPGELGSMSSLQALQLCCNELEGPIPKELGSLQKLTVLALQHNHLTAPIPSSLGKLSFLTRLDLSFNFLTGFIPPELANLPQLTILDVRNNNLSGSVPEGFRDLQKGFQYGNNINLCGDNFSGLSRCNTSIPFVAQQPLNTHAPKNISFPISDVPKLPQPADFSSTKCRNCSSSSSKRTQSVGIVSGIIATITGVIIIAALLFALYRRRKQKISSLFEADNSCRPSTDQYYDKELSRKCTSPLIDLEYSNNWDPLANGALGFGCFRFNLDEIEFATHYFSDKHLLGKNGFASVYKGFLRDGTVVAIKCINKTSCKTEDIDFQEGLKTFMELQHENVVKLHGFCCSKARGECFLVYEFVQNRTLLHNLDAETGGVLDWSTRVKIAHGIARGIEYLHQGITEPIVHQNISASNVLLDQHLNPLISDCALHKILADDIVFSILKASAAMGYLAPEYATTGRLTDKSDVYAFGKILLQLLTGTTKHDKHISSSHHRIKPLVELSKLEEFMDPSLKGKYSLAEAMNLAKIALACTGDLPNQRPSMSAVVQNFDTGIHQTLME